jgi:pimeloyl-ACP methyl ester carboxylesterase
MDSMQQRLPLPRNRRLHAAVLAGAVLPLGGGTRIESACMDETPAATRGFERLRRPVLGFVVEGDKESGRFRLVAVERDGAVLVEGPLEDCEQRLVEELRSRHGSGKLNLPFATLGGKQFWGDLFIQRGWRIQENVLTGHCRLLDPDDVRRAWGSHEACRVSFEEARLRLGIRPRSERLVVLLHGLGRSKASFRHLRVALERDDYEVADINFPSTRRSVREHADAIAALLARAEGIRTVSFVTHSLGGIVARDLLSREGEWKKNLKAERLVMIAPPNRGSAVAEALKDWLPYQTLLGEVGQELTPEAVARRPIPACEFGVIAGGKGNAKGLNPLLDGDNDGLVTVEETRLPGAADFLLIDASHTFIKSNERCIEATRRFLKSGKFGEQSGQDRGERPAPGAPEPAAPAK